ncbi:putative disease resistance protein RGA3 [Lycium barbarum]|uniref:putative disease resistance protein RGA3 n=1 Tax=Lycium barbarum TaxID=112863 RepID=UPI00293E6635|nr:putative disease resistance protein RGA3 [Lycium barbarum]
MGGTRERDMLHGNGETLSGTSSGNKALSEAAAESKDHRKSGTTIQFLETVQRSDNSSTLGITYMGGHGCASYWKSCHQKPVPLLLQNQQTVKDDDSLISETTYWGEHNCFRPLKWCYSRPPSLLMQNPQTLKITRIFRGVYILFIAIKAMASNRTLEQEGLDNSFEGANISQHLKLEELSDRLSYFCSLWPHNFEFHKDKCLQLWVAQGFFDFEFGRRIEVVANEHFEDVLKKNVIVQSRFCMATGMMMYVVNTVVSSSSSLWVREDKLQHLFLPPEKFEEVSFGTLEKLNQLRTLILFCQHGNSIKRVPSDFFLKLPHLRILDLQATNISLLPYSIGHLLSLRYLDVSKTRIKYLPETIGSLRYLQILKLQSCSNFYKLPECTNKLTSLRHLDLNIVGRLTSMPVGMGNLTSLQTLKDFTVGKEKGYGARELKHLNDLCGSFRISSVEEAREAEMNKKHLNELELQWEQYPDDFISVEDILECLQPHVSLKELTISFYSGFRFPTWMSNSYLYNIVSITLVECKSCSDLPSLGGLQSLKSLLFVRMYGVRSIDRHFCRYWGRQIGPAFSKLEKIKVEGIPKLEKWTGVENGDFPCLLELTVSCCPKLITIPVLSLSSLKTLTIFRCEDLQSLPKGRLSFPKGRLSSKLKDLYIANCPPVTNRCLKPQGEDWFKIQHIPSIIIDHEEMAMDPNH